MDIAGNPNTKNPNFQRNKKLPSEITTSKEPMKVKYISSPVMVNAKDAREFKSIVQQLTGKDSSAGRSPGSGSSRREVVAGGEHRALPQLGDGWNQAESYSSVGYQELDEYFYNQVSESLSKFEFP
ncbi:hypothetical protein M9H77_28769 [Catharanthus roseus]|uniref:Uncharacterized protein n=1 Tax=Catharanthus roseus TaxID=4058 RepID=A0ACC0AH96_CATRO|nr:hypothetical protein M9H77_28769 [Catharanthus roseus]